MAIETERCTWCGRPTGEGAVSLQAPNEEKRLRWTAVRSGCYREAISDPGVTPVRVREGDGRRVVRMPRAAGLGAGDCQFGADP